MRRDSKKEPKSLCPWGGLTQTLLIVSVVYESRPSEELWNVLSPKDVPRWYDTRSALFGCSTGINIPEVTHPALNGWWQVQWLSKNQLEEREVLSETRLIL